MYSTYIYIVWSFGWEICISDYIVGPGLFDGLCEDTQRLLSLQGQHKGFLTFTINKLFSYVYYFQQLRTKYYKLKVSERRIGHAVSALLIFRAAD
jgi:hypothetical protein